MSNYPPTPSFGSPFNYTQQWPPLLPSTSSMPGIASHTFPGPVEFLGGPPAQTRTGAGNPSDFKNMANFNANTRIPGLGGPGSLPPPAFPYLNQFQGPQIPPPPFHPVPIPPMGYPTLPPSATHVPAPSAFNYQLPVASQAQSNHLTGKALEGQGATTPSVREHTDREEGELSDRDGRISSQSRGEEVADRVARQYYRRSPQIFKDVRGRGSDVDLLRSRPSSGFDARQQATSNDSPERMDYEMTNILSSSDDRASRREDSGSPYHPPVSINIEPYTQDNVRKTTTTAEVKTISEQPHAKPSPTKNNDNRAPYLAGKSPAQLRVLAEGALLGLAPHNIRYDELVDEGINPVILKQLYDEVGIKVTTSLVEQKPAVETLPTNSASSAIVPQQPGVSLGANGVVQVTRTETQRPVPEPAKGDAKKRTSPKPAKATAQEPKIMEKVTVPPPVPHVASQTDTGKPLERKEVIARMLAAKAGKLSSLSSSSKAESVKDSSAAGASVSKPAQKPAQPATPNETQVKEKNKAQTELARQRIEQLKKQGLVRGQQRSQVESASSSTTQQPGQIQSSTNALISSTIQHPLPDRPPEPESAPAARIPGLFMTGTEQSLQGDSSCSIQSTVESTLPRKRPRASDFDELATPPKKHLGQDSEKAAPEDRLIIDISDDEYLYGENEDDDMDITNPVEKTLKRTLSDITSLKSQNFPPLTDLPPRIPATLPHQRTPASSTAQTPLRIGDQEELRLRDLQIQAMHRKIAELEERKKAKLAASRTHSPGSLNRSSSASLENPTAAQSSVDDVVVASTEVRQGHSTTQGNVVSTIGAEGSVSPNLNRSPSIQTRTSIDSTHLERIRSKFLRKKEIESGLPALDAELLKTEAKLAEFRKEEERLLAEIAKGREGRRQLMEELENLGVETEGLSLEELQAAKAELEDQERSTRLKAPVEGPSSVGPSNVGMMEDTASKARSLEQAPSLPMDLGSAAQITNGPTSVPQTSQEAIELTMSASAKDAGMDVTDGPGAAEPEDTSSASSGSAMDESIGSVHSMSIEQPAPNEEPFTAHATPSEISQVSEVSKPVGVEASSENRLHSLPERPPSPEDNIIPNGPTPGHTVSDTENVQTSRETSVVSDVYEPPEPEPNPDSADTVYTPPFSPASPGPAEPEEVAVPRYSLPEADKELTEDVQEPKPIDELQLDVLQGESRSKGLEHQFLPYISPLRYFKAYRYHPNFVEDVSEGYRSLTYSHNIDPMKTVCPYETAGGVCNDHSCEHQHFRDMSLSDDKILVQMGSLREGKTQEEKDNYIVGLKQIINDMRRDKVKDFSTVATEIAAYRRRFLQDPSRVLPL